MLQQEGSFPVSSSLSTRRPQEEERRHYLWQHGRQFCLMKWHIIRRSSRTNQRRRRHTWLFFFNVVALLTTILTSRVTAFSTADPVLGQNSKMKLKRLGIRHDNGRQIRRGTALQVDATIVDILATTHSLATVLVAPLHTLLTTWSMTSSTTSPVTTAANTAFLVDYSPAATALFNNMKTPASILAAGMVSLGFLAPFRLQRIQDDDTLLSRVEDLKRVYIVVTLISFCSELLAVMWATVAVNQLTERNDLLAAASVWELLERDFDLEWAATNSHFVLGMIGFMYMVGIRGYVMLLAEGASATLTTAALAGVASALALMVSVVNRGVAAGGGQGVGYGQNILDLFAHYVTLLYKRATDTTSFGPLELTAIVLQLISLSLSAYAIVSPKVAGLVEEDDEVNDNNGRTIPTYNQEQSVKMINIDGEASPLVISTWPSTTNTGGGSLNGHDDESREDDVFCKE